MSMWNRIKSWGVKTWIAIAGAVAAVLAFILKVVWDRQEQKSAATVTKAADVKEAGEFADGTAAAAVVGRAEGNQAAVVAEVTEAVASAPTGSPEQTDAIADTLSEMSRKRHEEALARAGKQ